MSTFWAMKSRTGGLGTEKAHTHTKCKSMFHGLIRPKSFVGTDSFDLAEHALAQRPERGKGDYCRKKGIVY